jgi:hypothetical protein
VRTGTDDMWTPARRPNVQVCGRFPDRHILLTLGNSERGSRAAGGSPPTRNCRRSRAMRLPDGTTSTPEDAKPEPRQNGR